MGGIIPGCRRIGMWVVDRIFIRVRKVGPYPAGEWLSERRAERAVFITYNWGYASQLKILEVIHLTLELLLRFGIFGIRVLPFSSMASPTLPLNIIMHFPRERVHLVAVGTGEKIFKHRSPTIRRETHLSRVINSEYDAPGCSSDAVRSGGGDTRR